MAYRRFNVNKLIRDYLSEIMRKEGIRVHEETMDDEQFIDALKTKLLEEAEEIRHSSSKEELVEELADALEVIQTLTKASGHSIEQIEKVRLEKRKTKGGFDRKIYAHYVDVEKDCDAIGYFLTKPWKYPELQMNSLKTKVLNENR